MLWKQLALAATAAAFLIVPETTEAENEFKTLPMDVNAEIFADAVGRTVDVPCTKCKGKDTHLSMDFAVEYGTKLTLNGYELYPSADPWHGDLTATVVKGNGKKKEQLLGYSLAVGPQAFDEQQHLEIVNVGLHIIEVGGRFIEGIPTITVKLIKAPTGEILIGDVSMQDVEQSECTDMWCRMRNGWDQAWKGLRKGCAKHMQHHGHGHHDKVKAEGKHPHHGRPSHDYNWGELLKNIAVSVLLPVLTGITAGVGVAVFAMGICSFVAILVRSRRRKCRRASRRTKTVVNEPAAEEEKTGLMDAQEDIQDAPPQYEDRQTSDQA